MLKTTTVLGLSIGTRQMGVAILDKYGHLRVRSIVFLGKWNNNKLSKIFHAFKRWATSNRITAVSIKIPNDTHLTPALRTLLEAIKEYCQYQKLQLYICTSKELKRCGMIYGKNKVVLISNLAIKYPVLMPYAHKELKRRYSHYVKLFEAVAAAELLQRQF